MGLTYAQSKAIGLGHLHPAASGTRSDETIIRELAGKRAPLPHKEPGDGMNKTERAFYLMLQSAFCADQIMNFCREPIKLRLAGRTWYTPDFIVRLFPADGSQLFAIEVKGFMRDDAAVKLKVAAETYPCFRWLLVRRKGRHGWDFREVGRTGIGTSPIIVPWIGGRA